MSVVLNAPGLPNFFSVAGVRFVRHQKKGGAVYRAEPTEEHAATEPLHAAKALTELDLMNNAITDEGVTALAACLREGAAPKLQRIGLMENEGVSEAAKQELREAREGLDV